jgi:hypothetical protein
MKISDAVSGGKRPPPALKERVLAYISERPDEVFTYRDQDLQEAVGASRAGLGFALWSLQKEGRIEKLEHEGRAFFGTSAAVAQMRQSIEEHDPWERARLLSKRIFDQHGPIRALDLLDDVRGPWD